MPITFFFTNPSYLICLQDDINIKWIKSRGLSLNTNKTAFHPAFFFSSKKANSLIMLGWNTALPSGIPANPVSSKTSSLSNLLDRSLHINGRVTTPLSALSLEPLKVGRKRHITSVSLALYTFTPYSHLSPHYLHCIPFSPHPDLHGILFHVHHPTVELLNCQFPPFLFSFKCNLLNQYYLASFTPSRYHSYFPLHFLDTDHLISQ